MCTVYSPSSVMYQVHLALEQSSALHMLQIYANAGRSNHGTVVLLLVATIRRGESSLTWHGQKSVLRYYDECICYLSDVTAIPWQIGWPYHRGTSAYVTSSIQIRCMDEGRHIFLILPLRSLRHAVMYMYIC